MAYVPNPTDASQPVEGVVAGTAAAEFRAIKAYLNSIVAAGLPPLTSDGDVLIISGGVPTWGATPNMFDFYNFT